MIECDRLIFGIDPEDNETKYKYDLNNNLVELTASLGNKTTDVYHSRDRLISETDKRGICRT